MPTKQWAEKAAALEAISVLHKAKELDHDLKPVPRGAMDDGGGDESDGEERTIKDAGTQKRSQIYKKEVNPLVALKWSTNWCAPTCMHIGCAVCMMHTAHTSIHVP